MWTMDELERFKRTLVIDVRCGAVALHPPHWYAENKKWCDGKNQSDMRVW